MDSSNKNVLTNIVVSQLSVLMESTMNKNAKQEIKKYTLVLREALQNKNLQNLFNTVDKLKLVNMPDNWKELLVQSGGSDEQFWEYFTNNVVSDLFNLENKLKDSKFGCWVWLKFLCPYKK